MIGTYPCTYGVRNAGEAQETKPPHLKTGGYQPYLLRSREAKSRGVLRRSGRGAPGDRPPPRTYVVPEFA